MLNKTEALQPETIYHIYNRANGNEPLFITNENYSFFLAKYKQYIHPICNTYCYCLMPNHFHLLIEIKNEDELITFFKKEKTGTIYSENLPYLISLQFSNFLNSYSKSFNKQHERKGNLFMRQFKRKKVITKKYLLKLVHYIHHNPVEAGLCNKINEWEYSSYCGLISSSPTLLQRNTVIEWFDNTENFMYVQNQKPKELDIDFDEDRFRG